MSDKKYIKNFFPNLHRPTVALVCAYAQPPTVVGNTEAQSEHVHIAFTFFARLAPDLHAQSVLSNKISASDLSQKFIKGALLVGYASN